MKPDVFILYHFFHPDDVVSARHFSQFAEELVNRNWQVTASPFTLAAEISALLAGADIADLTGHSDQAQTRHIDSELDVVRLQGRMHRFVPGGCVRYWIIHGDRNRRI